MFCPDCRTEYLDGFTNCSDCGAKLAVERPPEVDAPKGQPSENVAELCRTRDLFRADVIVSVLNGEGINGSVHSRFLEGSSVLSNPVAALKGIQEHAVLVPESRLAEAREIVAAMVPSEEALASPVTGQPIHPGGPPMSVEKKLGLFFLFLIVASILYQIFETIVREFR